MKYKSNAELDKERKFLDHEYDVHEAKLTRLLESREERVSDLQVELTQKEQRFQRVKETHERLIREKKEIMDYTEQEESNFTILKERNKAEREENERL